MTDVPGQLDVDWSPAAVEVSAHPLRTHPDQRERFWVAAVGTAGVLAMVAMVPLVALQMLGVVSDAFAPVVLSVVALTGITAEGGMRWRRENARLTLVVRPAGIEFIHALGPFPVVRESVDFDDLQRIQLDAHTLRLVLNDGRTICEPLPGLSEGAREWIVQLLRDARRTNADFWMSHAESQEAREAMRRLSESVSQTS